MDIRYDKEDIKLEQENDFRDTKCDDTLRIKQYSGITVKARSQKLYTLTTRILCNEPELISENKPDGFIYVKAEDVNDPNNQYRCLLNDLQRKMNFKSAVKHSRSEEKVKKWKLDLATECDNDGDINIMSTKCVNVGIVRVTMECKTQNIKPMLISFITIYKRQIQQTFVELDLLLLIYARSLDT